MDNAEFIITLLNIKGIGRKTVNKIKNIDILDGINLTKMLNYINSLNLKYKKIITKDELENANKIAQNTIEICKKEDIKISTILDEDFPEKLKSIDDNPAIIYYKGNKNCLNNKSIAIIGSRNPSLHGSKVSYKISYILSQRGYVIVSGLANGCDTFAHLGSLDSLGRTVAVMPCGLNIVYPKQNQDLFNKIIQNNGCVMSEYPPNQNVSKYQLVERDRLQSALSQGIIVIETAINGGSFHAVNHGLKHNKIIGCYKHSDDYINLKSVQGNLKLLQNTNIMKIWDEESLNNFTEKVNDIFNLEKNKHNNLYKNLEQLQFDFYNTY